MVSPANEWLKSIVQKGLSSGSKTDLQMLNARYREEAQKKINDQIRENQFNLREIEMFFMFFTKGKNSPESLMDFSSIFPPMRPIPLGPFCYQANTNDFGMHIKSLIFPDPALKSHVQFSFLLENLRKIADLEGFELLTPEQGFYPRDSIIRLGEKRFALLGFETTRVPLEKIRLSALRALSYAAYFKESAQFVIRAQCFLGATGSVWTDFKAKTHRVFLEMFPEGETQFFVENSEAIERMCFAVEGGNVLTFTNTEGKRKVLIGKDHLLAIHVYARQIKYFRERPLPEIQIKLSDEDVRQYAEEMYALGFLRIDGKEGFVSFEGLQKCFERFYDPTKPPVLFKDIMVRDGGLTPFKWDKKDAVGARPIVMKFLAERALLLDSLATLFEVPKEDISFISQYAYHLDIFIKSGPNGSLFVQDFDACVHVIEEILRKAMDLELSFPEINQLFIYLDVAKEGQEKLGKVMQKTRTELESAGFVVIPTPGIFYSHDYKIGSAAESYHFNFLNAVSGWSSKTDSYYYIATGAQIEEKLGRIFMKMFEQFLQKITPNLKVYFIGHNEQGNFSEAMGLWNYVEYQGARRRGGSGGIHCFTLEHTTENHNNE